MAAKLDNPTDPRSDEWLRSLDGRAELTIRLAMRARFPEAKASDSFNARIDALLESLALNDKQRADILEEALRVEEDLDAMFQRGDATPPGKTPPPAAKKKP